MAIGQSYSLCRFRQSIRQSRQRINDRLSDRSLCLLFLLDTAWRPNANLPNIVRDHHEIDEK